MLWLIVATMAGAIYVLLRASLRRGRDSFYPMAGAICIAILYGFDAYFEDGRYLANLQHESADVFRHW